MTARRDLIENPVDNRKQRRFKANEAQSLTCIIEVDGVEASSGTVVDLSNNGLRLLGSGQYREGQLIRISIKTELSTEKLRGEVRYVEPRVGGQTILGCSLNESVSDRVLHELVDQGFLNRRCGPRIQVAFPAKMVFPSQPGRVDAEVRDYSNGGLMIHTDGVIPDDHLLSVVFEGDDDLPFQAKLQWRRLSNQGCLAGLEFVNDDSLQRVVRVLGLSLPSDEVSVIKNSSRGWSVAFSLGLVAVALLTAGFTALQMSGFDLPWAIIFSM